MSVYLWSWITQTTDYIMNCISSTKHLRKTSFEMIIDQKFNLTHLVQYKTKTYSVNKDISNREKIKIKAYIDFMMNYDNINIWLVRISNQRKMIWTRDVIFDENSHYQSYEINAIQLIKESFLKNDILKILQNDFTKFIEIKSNSDEKLFKLISTEILVVYLLNDKKLKKQSTKTIKKICRYQFHLLWREKTLHKSYNRHF